MSDTTETNQTPSLGLARWLSWVFHPFLLTALTLPAIIYMETGSLPEATGWAVVYLTAFLIPFAIVIMALVFAGRYSDTDISIREQRHGLYLASIPALALMAAAFTLGNAPHAARVCAYAAVCGIVISAAINRLSKVSVHSMIAAGCAATLTHFSLPAGLAMGAAAASVGWSRVRLKRHTWPQVTTGWATAIVCVAAMFYIYP